jgi:hypothetical protein
MTIGSGLFSKQRARLAHLVRGGGGLAGEVADLRSDIDDELDPLVAVAVEEFIDPAAADVNAIKASIASAASIEVYEGAALDGVVGLGVMDPPRNPTVTTSLHADIDAVTVVFEGKDINGADISVDVLLTDGGNTTDVGAGAMASVSKITVPAQAGTGGALEFGFGDIIGLAKPIKSRAGLASLTREIAAGSLVTSGTIADAATGAPNGTYLASSVPDAANDYAVYYEWDATA